jgi:hypothetical protein
VDPFSAPDSAPHLSIGNLDLGAAVSDGLSALLRNLGPLLIAGVLLFVGYLVSLCTCVGWIALFPLMLYGMYRFQLEVIDGRGRLSTLWSGTERFADVFARMWGLILLYIVVSLPMLVLMAPVLGWMLYEATQGREPDPVLFTLAMMVPSVLIGLVLVRFMGAGFLVVESDIGPYEALTTSWSSTGAVWSKLIVLQLLIFLLQAPAQVLSVGNQLLTRSWGDDPSSMTPDMLGLSGVLSLGVFGWSMGMALVTSVIYAAAYRQIFGRAPAAV